MFDTAILAGVMAAQRTSELIPFCHPLALEQCRIEIGFDAGSAKHAVVVVRCRVEVRHKTGVEMEALTGASVAALTIYDMCKALSHDIRIERVRLLSKSGGRRLIRARPSPAPEAASLRTRRGRMNRARLGSTGWCSPAGTAAACGAIRPACRTPARRSLARALQLLEPLIRRCFVSVRADQLSDPQRAAHDTIADIKPDLGPIGGIHAALQAYPARAWLVLACDLPFLDAATLQRLIARRAPARLATAYRSSFDGLPEALCAIFEPRSRERVEAWIEQGQVCPRELLAQSDVELLDPPEARALDNINTVEQYAAAAALIGTGALPEAAHPRSSAVCCGSMCAISRCCASRPAAAPKSSKPKRSPRSSCTSSCSIAMASRSRRSCCALQ